MDRSRLLLISPEPASSATFASLESFGYDVDQCRGGLDAMLAVAHRRPDIVLLDCRTEALHGIQLCRSLRAIPETRDVPLLILVASAGDELCLEALEAGADDCLTQPVTTRESVLRLRAAQRRRDQASTSPLLRYEQVELDLDTYKVRRHGALLSVTSMQFRLLRHFLEHPLTVFSRQQLLDAVWHDTSIDEGAVTACVVRLRRALNAAGGPNLIRSVPGNGYSLDAQVADAV